MASNPLYNEFINLRNSLRDFNVNEIYDLLSNAPKYYVSWWMHLYRESPHHIVIETSLVLFIIWLFFIRRTVDPKKTARIEKLTKKEEEWLLETWEPEPLIPVDSKKSSTFRYKLDDIPVI